MTKTTEKSFERLGMTDMFLINKADLSKISDEPGLHVSDIAHKALIEVNEDSTEAAAFISKISGYVS